MPQEPRFTFDEVAELYDRARPQYPEVLFEDVLSLSHISTGDRVLEVGCGTGQATLPLARRGLRMLCLEPGLSLARLARLKLASFTNVEVVSQTFEDWPLEAGAFSLVISAQAFHWVAPEVRFAKTAAALDPAGALAVFGNVQIFDRSRVREALDKVYALHAPSIAGPSPTRWYAEDGPIPRLFAESGCFGPVTCRSYPWSQGYAPAEYLDLLLTSSDHRLLPPGQRGTLLNAVRQAIEMHGGRIELQYEAHLYVARRALS
jgi:SAM-dependent methyltransferase